MFTFTKKAFSQAYLIWVPEIGILIQMDLK